jgi:hypothetical protein
MFIAASPWGEAVPVVLTLLSSHTGPTPPTTDCTIMIISCLIECPLIPLEAVITDGVYVKEDDEPRRNLLDKHPLAYVLYNTVS